MSRIRAALSVVAVVAFAAGAFVFAGASANAAAEKITICHRTNSDTNPYVEISPSANGVLNGHAAHHNEPFVWTPTLKASGQKWGDIIPAFDDFPGLNLTTVGGFDGTTTGQEILDNGCVVPNDVPPPPVEHGDLVVTKDIVGTPTGESSFTVHVACDDDSVDEDVVFTTNGESKTYTDLVAGINCTVEETANGGATVTYDPTDVATNGIEIQPDTSNEVTVTNTFTPAPVTPTGPTVSPTTATDPGTTAAPAAVVAAPQFTG